jgi:membrane protein YdbS with pleckstrin-like domain
VPLVSGPLIAAAALPAIVAHLAGPRMGLHVPSYALAMLWAMVAMARLFAGSIQWLGRLYVLTNRRLITVRGVARFQVYQCPLTKVRGVSVSMSPSERLLGLGTLSFQLPPGAEVLGAWVNLARPEKVRQEIEQAIRRGNG